MSELTTQTNDISVWDNKEEIKRLYAEGATDKELGIFMQIGATLNANPATREIFFVKYKETKASIMLGVNFYIKIANSHPDYDGHQTCAIFEEDEFYIEKGEPVFKRAMGNRGALVGAFSVVYKKNTKIPMIVEVSLDEYIQYTTDFKTKEKRPNNMWGGKPQTMICKVAESQALRKAFPEQFNGTYSEAEQWEDAEYEDVTNKNAKPKDLPKKEIKKNTYNINAIQSCLINCISKDLFDDNEINAMGDWVDKVIRNGNLTQEDILGFIKGKGEERFNNPTK